MIWLGLVLWHINHYRLFNVISSIYIYIKYILFGSVWFYGLSTIVGYLIPNHLYTYLKCKSCVLWHINHYCLFSCQIQFIHIIYIYIIFKHKSTEFKGSKYCYLSTILLNICHLFTHSYLIKQFHFKQFYLV